MSTRTILDGLEQAVARYPGRIALIDRDEPLTYCALWQRVGALAALLHRQGLQCGDRVALLLESSADYVAAYYGAMAAGCVAVPLNAAAKASDITAWLKHSGARVMFAHSNHPQLAAMAGMEGCPPILRIDLLGDLPAPPEARPPLAITDYACILYTSGTTGAPKGVLLTHGNLIANSTAILRYLSLTERDSIVCVLPFYYSYGSSILHTHLLVGGCIVIEPNLVYPHIVMENLARHRATGFAGVPSTFALLLSRVALERYDLSNLRYLTQAGGPMSVQLTQRLRKALPGVQLFVMYGQTEATARLTYLPPESIECKKGSVGIPVSGVSVQIRAEDGAPCPPRHSGEVWVKGPNIMAGYWRDHAATSAAVHNGWLRTGDAGYLDADGYLFLLGRRSDMIKAGSHRIHPDDIEEAIQEIEEVAEVAVVGAEDEILGQAIKAFIVARAGLTVDPLKIKAHCRERLAAYKVPKHIEIIDALPRTSSGKIRRHELQERKTT